MWRLPAVLAARIVFAASRVERAAFTSVYFSIFTGWVEGGAIFRRRDLPARVAQFGVRVVTRKSLLAVFTSSLRARRASAGCKSLRLGRGFRDDPFARLSHMAT